MAKQSFDEYARDLVQRVSGGAQQTPQDASAAMNDRVSEKNAQRGAEQLAGVQAKTAGYANGTNPTAAGSVNESEGAGEEKPKSAGIDLSPKQNVTGNALYDQWREAMTGRLGKDFEARMNAAEAAADPKKLQDAYRTASDEYDKAKKAESAAKEKMKTAPSDAAAEQYREGYESAKAAREAAEAEFDRSKAQLESAGVELPDTSTWGKIKHLFTGEGQRTTDGFTTEQAAQYKELLSRLDGIQAASAFALTTEQSDALEKERAETLSALHQMDADARRAERAYDARDRAGAFFKSWGKGTAASYTNTAGSMLDLADVAHQASSETQRHIADNPYAGYVTDPLSEANFAAAPASEETSGFLASQRKERDALYETADKLLTESEQQMAKAKQGTSAAAQFALDAAKTGMDIAADTAASAIGVPGLANMAVRVYGSEAQQARLSGDDAQTAAAKGMKAAMIEVLTEKISGPFEKAYGSSLGKAAAATKVGKAVNAAVDKLKSSGLIRLAMGAAGEGFEEGMSDVLNTVADHVAGWDDGTGTIWDDIKGDKEQILYDMLLGAFVGAFGGAGNLARGNANVTAEAAPTQQTTTEAQSAAPTQQTAPAASAESRALMESILAGGRVNTTTANAILADQQLTQAFTELTGISLSGNTADMRTQISNGARAYSYSQTQTQREESARAAEKENISAEMARQNEQLAALSQEEAARDADWAQRREEMENYDSYDSYIRGAIRNGMSFAEAGEIARTPKLRSTWERMTGQTLPESTTKAREAIMNYHADAATPGKTFNAVDALADYGKPAEAAQTRTKTQGDNPAPAEAENVKQTGSDALNSALNLNNVETQTEGTIEERRAALDQRLARLMERIEAEGENPAAQDALTAEAEAIDAEDRAIKAAEEQSRRVEAGEVSKAFGSPENHIDNRSFADAANKGTKAFQFDYPELHGYFVEAAQSLLADVQAAQDADYLQRYKKGGADYHGPISRLVDSGMTKPRMIQCLTDIINNNGAENYADAKRVEIVLNDMLSNGWLDMARKSHAANADYISAKDGIVGAVKADSWEKYRADHELSLVTGLATEEELRAEWEAGQPKPADNGTKAQKNTASTQETEKPRLSMKAPTLDGGSPEKTSLSADTSSVGETDASLDGARRLPSDGSIPGGVSSEASEASASTTSIPTTAQDAKSENQENTEGTQGRPRSDQRVLEDSEGSPKEKERGFSKNVRTDNAMEPKIRESFDTAPETYEQLANKDTLAKAEEIFARGLDEARGEVEQALGAAKSGSKLAPEMVPLARMVANELSKNGDVETARRILADVATELTAAGQLGQAGRILRDSDPNAALASIQKTIDAINAEFEKQHKRSKWRAELTEAETQEILSTDFTESGAYERIYEKVATRLGKEMPSSVLEKLTEIRRINMLLRPRTQIKNIASNVPMVGLRKGAETLSIGIQSALTKIGLMKEADRTRGRASKEQRQLARDYYEANKAEINGQSNKWDLKSVLREKRTIFKGGAIEKAVSKMTGKEIDSFGEALRQVTYSCLEKGDAPFVKSAFVDSLAQYCAAKGITTEAGITQEAIDFATANAMEATFKNANVIADIVNRAKRNSSPAVSAAIDVLIPFTTTPANILSLMGDYSPVGFARMISKDGPAAKIDAFSKASVGTAMLALGFALRNAGKITGGEDDDKDKAALDKATGQGTYSIGGRVSYDWAQPVGSLLAFGAEIADAVKGQEGWDSALMNAIYTAGDSALNLSLFQNIISVLRGSGKPTQQIIDAIMEGGATQLVPGLAGDIAKIIDGTVRSTYTGGNVFNDIGAKVLSTTPGFSKKLPASVNVRGEENTRSGLAARAFNMLLNPTNYTGGKRNAVDEEIYRLHDATGGTSFFPSVSPYKIEYGNKLYTMNGKDRETFQKVQGQTYYELAKPLLDSEMYKALSDEQKADVLKSIRDYALDEAKRQLVDGRGGEYSNDSWDAISALSKAGISEYLPAAQALKDGKDGTGGSATYDAIDLLLGKYGDLSAPVRDELERKGLNVPGLRYSHALGMGAEDWYSAHEAVAEGEKTLGGTDAAKAISIYNSMEGKSDEEILNAMRAQLMPKSDDGGKQNATVRRAEAYMTAAKNNGAEGDLGEWLTLTAELKDADENDHLSKDDVEKAWTNMGLDAKETYAGITLNDFYNITKSGTKSYANNPDYATQIDKIYAELYPDAPSVKAQLSGSVRTSEKADDGGKTASGVPRNRDAAADWVMKHSRAAKRRIS